MTRRLDRRKGIPFYAFTRLLEDISQVPRQTCGESNVAAYKNDHRVFKIFQQWAIGLRREFSPLHPTQRPLYFACCFPTRITSARSHSSRRAEHLEQWKEGSGCLGQVVTEMVEARYSGNESDEKMYLHEVDMLLTELASTSAWSDDSIRQQFSPECRRKRGDIIDRLFFDIPSRQAGFLTQIILKDLRPLLYPLPPKATDFTRALRQYNSNAIRMLTVESAMEAWDPRRHLLNIFRLTPCIWKAGQVFEKEDPISALRPRLGRPVTIPKCRKGQSCADALKPFQNSDVVWAETKYDGERCQIHVQVNESGESRITIFSKSKRDSTLDRHDLHNIIRRALRLSDATNWGAQRGAIIVSSPIQTNIILEAEMVAYHEMKERIDEFYTIAGLIGETAYGIRGTVIAAAAPVEDTDSQQTQVHPTDYGQRHLALVFFDILMVDSAPLLHLPYSIRRSMLESYVRVRKGEAMLAERFKIDMKDDDRGADENLNNIFAASVADFQEGLVLKASESAYNDLSLPWVKLKRDYIKGLGDTIDFCLLGGSWEKDRGRELGVGPDGLTDFYMGVLINSEEIKRDPSTRPRFYILFAVSYGLTRVALDNLTYQCGKYEDRAPYDRSSSEGLTYDHTLAPGLSSPEILLVEPLVAEVYGAGFTKAQKSKYYEPRFPRMNKVYMVNQRRWTDCMDMQELQETAWLTVGRNRRDKESDDKWNKAMKRSPSPGDVRSSAKRKAIEDELVEKLQTMSKKPRRGDGESGKTGGKKPTRYKWSADGHLLVPVTAGTADESRATLNATGSSREGLKDANCLIASVIRADPSGKTVVKSTANGAGPSTSRSKYPTPSTSSSTTPVPSTSSSTAPTPSTSRATSIQPPAQISNSRSNKQKSAMKPSTIEHEGPTNTVTAARTSAVLSTNAQSIRPQTQLQPPAQASSSKSTKHKSVAKPLTTKHERPTDTATTVSSDRSIKDRKESVASTSTSASNSSSARQILGTRVPAIPVETTATSRTKSSIAQNSRSSASGHQSNKPFIAKVKHEDLKKPRVPSTKTTAVDSNVPVKTNAKNNSNTSSATSSPKLSSGALSSHTKTQNPPHPRTREDLLLFLYDSLVWLAKPRVGYFPRWDSNSYPIPFRSHVYWLEDILRGTDWSLRGRRSPATVKQGVIFVAAEGEQWWEEREKTLKTLRKELMAEPEEGVQRKPIYVFEAPLLKMTSWDKDFREYAIFKME